MHHTGRLLLEKGHKKRVGVCCVGHSEFFTMRNIDREESMRVEGDSLCWTQYLCPTDRPR
jgi:hypothetical protein